MSKERYRVTVVRTVIESVTIFVDGNTPREALATADEAVHRTVDNKTVWTREVEHQKMHAEHTPTR